MRRTVGPARIDGVLRAPPSKSVMLRVTAAALLAAERTTTILNPSHCGDALSGLRVAEALGAEVTIRPDAVTIEGGLRLREGLLDCGESGLCIRMFTAIAALGDEEITLTGQGSLLRRPTTAVEETITALGAECRTRDGRPPVTVRGPLKAGEAVVDGAVSSQFLSGLLLALPMVEGESVLNVTNLASRPYVDLTLSLLESFGVRIEREGYERFTIPGGQRVRIGEHRVEGDWSAAAFLLVLGALGGRMRVTGLDPASTQADRQVLEILESAGARVVRHPDGAETEKNGLHAFECDLWDAPDLLPPLAALACHCDGKSVLRGIRRLRHKECSRAEAVARELSGLGVALDLRDDALEIRGGPVAGGRGDAHEDHRVAMALATVAVAAGGPVGIDGAEHVGKSYPGFFTDLAEAGGAVLDRHGREVPVPLREG